MFIATPETETVKPSAGLLVAGRSLQSFVATTVVRSHRKQRLAADDCTRPSD
jgi:hypothetical protein